MNWRIISHIMSIAFCADTLERLHEPFFYLFSSAFY
nr:MAG TPA: hypothetical protein [Caudoviricetes sp.]